MNQINFNYNYFVGCRKLFSSIISLKKSLLVFPPGNRSLLGRSNAPGGIEEVCVRIREEVIEVMVNKISKLYAHRIIRCYNLEF